MESSQRYVCNRCGRCSIENGCWREEYRFDSERCESIKCFVVDMTPSNIPLKEGELPQPIQRYVAHDLLIFGNAIVQKTTYDRVAYGEKRKYDRYIYYPIEQMTIGQLKYWGNYKGFTKFIK